MDTSPKRYHKKFASTTLPRSRSSSNTLTRKKDLSIDEDSALNDMHRRADKQYEDQKKREAMAMKYWEEKKIEEQEKFSDEENDYLSSRYKAKDEYTRSPRSRSRGLKNTFDSKAKDSRNSSTANGIEAVKVWQDKFHDEERQLKESMLSNAQLYKEKTALVFQVESLKDRLEDASQDYSEVKSELSREQSQALHQQHGNETLQNEIENLKKQITFRDEFLERLGLHLPTGDDDEVQSLVLPTPEMDPEEKEKLLKEIERLKEEISSMRSSSLLGDQQPKDIVQVSTKMVSEYKTKLQISDAENSRLDGLVTRLKGQVTRYKNQVKDLEEREDQLMKEKRLQAKEIRGLQSESEDQKTEIDLMKKRIEQVKKRRDYSMDS